MAHIYTIYRTALQIADRAVIADIECEGCRVGQPAERLWDVSAMFDKNEHCPEFLDMAEQGIAYGVMRGLIQMETGRRWTVRILRDLPT